MTREQAVACAARVAVESGEPQAVYRLPMWRVDVFGVRNPGKLPSDADTFERFAPPPSIAEPIPAPPPPAPDPGAQRCLFGLFGPDGDAS